MSIKQKIRFLFWGSISVASYVFSILLLFKNLELLLSLVPIFVFFIVFHFFYIELFRFKQTYVWAFIVAGMIATGFIMIDQSIVMWIANIAFHATIWRLAYSLYWETDGTTGFDGFTYFSAGGYIFTMMLSFVYSIFIVHSFSQFPLNCDELNKKTDSIIEFAAKPLKLSWEKTQQISSGVKTFLDSPMEDIRMILFPDSIDVASLGGGTEGGSLQSILEGLNLESLLGQSGVSPEQLQEAQQNQSLEGLVSSITASLGIGTSSNQEMSKEEKNNKLKAAISSLKQNLVTTPMEENEKLNTTICEVTLQTVNRQMQSPTIQYSVIFMILLLIYPFLRIVIWVMTFIGFVIFSILYLFRLYTKQIETKEVERIS